MLGLFERIGEGLEMISLPISGVVSKARCEVANAIIDIKTDAKVRKYQKARLEAGDTLDDDEEDIEEFEEEMLSEEQAQAYEKMFAEIVQHEEFCTRKPSEIGVELGYSEEEVKECFEYAQQKMKEENYMSNRFRRNAFLYSKCGLGKGISMMMGEGTEK